jgi:hypothetical protein
MGTTAATIVDPGPRQDSLSGTPRAHAIDRWIYVFTAASLIVIALAGFIPDSIEKIAAVQAGQRPPFPLILHVHAVLMGSFLLLLLAQTTLVALGRCDLHRRVGWVAAVLAPALVVAGLLLVQTSYRAAWDSALAAAPAAREQLQQIVLRRDNIMLLQLRIGVLFPVLLAIGLLARKSDAGLHKRMMILAIAMTLPAGIDRIHWLPTTFPGSPLGTDLYTLLAVTPMFAWDVWRNRAIHKAYWIWLAVSLPLAVIVHGLWNTAWWQATAPRLMGP